MKGGARSGEGAVIKVAKAEGDGAAIRDRRGTESVGEGAAKRMEKDSSRMLITSSSKRMR